MYADFEDLREGFAEPEFQVIGNVVNLSQRSVWLKSAMQTDQYVVAYLVGLDRMDVNEFGCSTRNL